MIRAAWCIYLISCGQAKTFKVKNRNPFKNSIWWRQSNWSFAIITTGPTKTFNSSQSTHAALHNRVCVRVFDKLLIDCSNSSEDERVKGAVDPDLSSPCPAPAAKTSKSLSSSKRVLCVCVCMYCVWMRALMCGQLLYVLWPLLKPWVDQ